MDQDISNIEPDKEWAKIAIKISSSLSLERVRDIMQTMGIGILEIKPISEEVFEFLLHTQDIRPIVLELVENGFLEIRGLNVAK